MYEFVTLMPKPGLLFAFRIADTRGAQRYVLPHFASLRLAPGSTPKAAKSAIRLISQNAAILRAPGASPNKAKTQL